MKTSFDIPLFKRRFPLKSCHQGAPLGNGRMGLLVWGEKNVLRLTVGRADLWDHRGGMSWSEKQSLEAVSGILRSDAPEKIDTLFPQSQENPPTPSILPLGRIEIKLPGRTRLESFSLELRTGTLKLFYRRQKQRGTMTVRIGVKSDQLFCLSSLPEGSSVAALPAWELSDALKKRDILPPLKKAQMFTQTLPADPPCSLEFRVEKGELQGRTFREDIPEWKNMTDLEKEDLVFWGDFWNSAPRIATGSRVLDESYYLGLYKFGAGCCHKTVPPGLQGPWIEDDDLPPWGSDYHFNINVQMFFMGAFTAGKSTALLPLFRMIASWEKVLAWNAHCFAGCEAGVMLPHAVDDRCRCMGNFWSGAVDHGCTIWMAQMMFRYVQYTNDLTFLREFAFEFMKKTMAVCRKMLARDEKGGLFLPFGVSPEYRGNAPDAWGVNPSFQLAAIRNLAGNLAAASAMLKEKCDDFWLEIQRFLPEASLCMTPDGEEIGLWEGTPLEESHRHHSHLAGIFPFDTLDAESPRWEGILKNTLKRWSEKGMGIWTGWALAWASMLYTRFRNPDMAEFCLELQRRFFTNGGGASLHDSLNRGFSVIDFGHGREIMQLDGALGGMSAVQDMFFFESRGVFKLFYGVPRGWKKAEFRNFSAPGGVTLSGQMKSGRTQMVELQAERSCKVVLSLPDGESFFAENSRTKTIELKKGRVCRLTPKKGCAYE